MKTALIAMLQALLAVLNEEQVKGFIDKGLDYLEDKIEASVTTWDDVMILPIINHFRKIMNIPDLDDEAPK